VGITGGGRLGSLYRLVHIEVLKPLPTPVPDTVLLDFPYARLVLPQGTWCRVGRRYPAHPEVGRRVLVLVSKSRYALDRQRLRVWPEDSEIFFESAEDALSAPDDGSDHLKAKEHGSDESLGDLIERVRRALSDRPPGGSS
jgi:hypothetical protein